MNYLLYRSLAWLGVPSRLVAFALGLIAVLTSGRAAEPALRRFDIAAGPAETTLRQFADQAGDQFVFSAEKVAGVQTAAVRGQLTARQALERMIAATELRAVQDSSTGALTVDRLAAPRANGGGHGEVTGRVFNQETGSYVNNARVAIAGSRIETFTDEFGYYSLPRVPAGAATLQVFYTGLPTQAEVVTVTAGSRTVADVTLRASADATKTVVLDTFTVASQRDMAASDIAVNEQRFSAAIKNVVATDSFGDIAEGNVGEFAKFLPGVTLNRDGSDGRSISLGGVPPSGTPIMVDGNALASASSSNANRTVELEQISITGMSRVEVTRSQTPDSPANAIGGTVNLVSKSAFERARPQYAFRTYLSFKGGDFELKKRPDPFAGKSYPFEPNFELSAVVPVNKKFGFTLNGLVTRAPANGQGSTQDWVPTVLAQSANYIATTPDNPYLARFRLQERPKISIRESLSATADWRVSDAGVLTFGMQYAYFKATWWVRQLNFDVGRVASFGPDFTQGAPGAGFTQIVYDARNKNGTTYMPSIKYRHNGAVWQSQLGGAFSRASNHYRDIDKGYFRTNNAFMRNVTVRFEEPTYDHPSRIIVTNAAGQQVDPFDISNYSVENFQAAQFDGFDTVRSLYANTKRDLNLRLPVTLKTGVDYRSQTRDVRRPTMDVMHVGPDGAARTADDNAAQWFDPVYSQQELLYGFGRMQWLDIAKVGDTYRANPQHFTQTETNRVNGFRSGVTTSQRITESVLAPYLRLDAKLFGDRLQLTGGVRYEETRDKGEGPLVDPTRIFQRDANGQIARNAAGQPVVVAPLATLAGTQLAYIERGSKTDTRYDGFFPSLSGTLLLRNNLLARFSYGRSINRPDFSEILPSVILPDPTSTGRIINITDGTLTPWTADSYGVALEYYFDEPSSGVLSARLYRRDIKNFWGTIDRPATNELLEPLGLDPAVYGQALGYQIRTSQNVGSARVSGMEFDYRQNLAFLPSWARGFTVFGNLTLQHLEGNEMASFEGFVGKTTNYGISFSRSRFTIRVAVNLKGLVKDAQITNAGTEPGTFEYIAPRRSADLTAEYRLNRRFSIFAAGRNINEAIDDILRYGPSTPRDRILRARADYRAYWNVGVKGTF